MNEWMNENVTWKIKEWKQYRKHEKLKHDNKKENMKEWKHEGMKKWKHEKVKKNEWLKNKWMKQINEKPAGLKSLNRHE